MKKLTLVIKTDGQRVGGIWQAEDTESITLDGKTVSKSEVKRIIRQ